MNITLIAVAVVIILAGIVSSRSSLINQTDDLPENEVLSVETEESEPTEVNTASPAPTNTPVPSTAPTEEPKKVVSENSWVYPGASVLSNGDVLVLSSSDNTDAITDWYKDKIESGGYNVKTSIKTSANDVVKNVINAANGNESVNVEITKDGGDARIEVEISSF